MNTLQRLRPFTLSTIVILVLAVGILVGCGPKPTPTPPPTNTPFPTNTSVPEPKFNYQFRVTDSTVVKAIEGAQITLTFTDQPPKYRFTDTNGYATFQIDSEYVDQSAQVFIEADGFQSQTRFLTIAKDELPYDIRLVPVDESVNITPVLPTETPTETIQPAVPTATPTLTPTQTPIPATATPTFTLTPSPTATSTPDLDTATAVLQAAIFAEPNTESKKLAYLEPGDEVTVFAITSNGSWLLVRNDGNLEGFVSSSYVEYYGNPPTVTPSPTPWHSPTPLITATFSPLNIDFWELLNTGRCINEEWHKRIYIRGLGGDLNYTYSYFNDTDRIVHQLAQRYDDSFTFEVGGSGTEPLRLTGEVHSGDGQMARQVIVVEPYPCP